MKRILLIGDLTLANNWGAIGTSKTLINQLFSQVGEEEVTIIDFRSFVANTPAGGWGNLNIMDAYNRFSLETDWVPHTFDEFDATCMDIIDGKKFQYEMELMKNHQIVVINGEGNIVNQRPTENFYRRGARYILLMAYFAKKYLNKPCVLINHTVDPKNPAAEEMIRNVYPLLDFITVREKLSLEELRKIGIQCKVKFAPDALFGVDRNLRLVPNRKLRKQIDFSKPYICLGDSSGVPYVSWNIYIVYKTIVRHLRRICNQIVIVNGNSTATSILRKVADDCRCGWVSVDNCNYLELMEVLRGALIYISGRWHASILSILVGTPILLWGADSHKTRGLADLIDYPYQFYPLNSIPCSIRDLMRETKEIIEDRQNISFNINKRVTTLVERSMDNLEFLNFIKS